MSKPKFVILTVPHANGCDPTGRNHICDYNAESMADSIADAFDMKKIRHSDPFVARVGRTEIGPNGLPMDMNRKWTRDTRYRKDITNSINSALQEGYDVWVIDVHSFPPDYTPFTKGKKRDFVILDTMDYKEGEAHVTPYVKELVDYMTDHGSLIVYMEGSHPHPGVLIEGTNDIMDTSRYFGAKSFLIETNEIIDKERMTLASDSIVEFIRQYK